MESAGQSSGVARQPKAGDVTRVLAQSESIRIVVNVEENVFLVKDKETVRTKIIILFEYVSW